MKQTIIAVVAACIGLAASAGELPPVAGMQAAAEKAAPSIVTVEYELKVDRGEEPPGMYAQVSDERPLELPGFLISPTECAVFDRGLNERFIRSTRVRLGDRVVDARPKAFLLDQAAVILEFDEPFEAARPLAFDTEADGELVLAYSRDVTGWITAVATFTPGFAMDDRGMAVRNLSYRSGAELVTNAEGVPVGILLKKNYRLDEPWKGNPAQLEHLTAQQLAQLAERVEQISNDVIPRVRLNFRSPKASGADRYATAMFSSSFDGESATEQNVTGLIVGSNRVLVLAALQPKMTALLERITVFTADGKAVGAAFEHTLKDFGAFTAILDEPAGRRVEFPSQHYRDLPGKLLLGAEVRIHGEDRIVETNRRRIQSYEVGWQRRMYLKYENGGEEEFVFNLSGELVALPLAERERVTSSRYSYHRGSSGESLPVIHLKEILDSLSEHVDPGNVPRSEEDENMLAWLGVELQALNRELARINNVSHLTSDGETGALVSHVYPGSPADEAGVGLGDVLLRLHVEGQPRPLEVKLEDRFIWSNQPFPWDRLDEVPEQYYEEIPAPWPSVENSFIRALTDFGIGKAYTAEFFHNGEVVAREFEIVQGPPHYEAAPRHKSEELGLTVRDLTFEVRRYLQRTPDDPGLIISNIEMGSRASVAGMKPYEIITHINGKPVHNVKQFEEMIAGETEMRFSVNRMRTGRIVKISLPETMEE